MERDNSSREDALGRLRSQIPIAEKIEYADQVIDNSGSLHDLEVQVELFMQRLESESGWTWRASWLFPPFGLLSALWVLAWRAIRRSRKSTSRRQAAQT
jgi:dephospho-CoA kinase